MAKVPSSFWVKFASVFFFFYPQEWLQMFFLFGSTIAEGIGSIYFVAREWDLEVVLYTPKNDNLDFKRWKQYWYGQWNCQSKTQMNSTLIPDPLPKQVFFQLGLNQMIASGHNRSSSVTVVSWDLESDQCDQPQPTKENAVVKSILFGFAVMV